MQVEDPDALISAIKMKQDHMKKEMSINRETISIIEGYQD